MLLSSRAFCLESILPKNMGEHFWESKRAFLQNRQKPHWQPKNKNAHLPNEVYGGAGLTDQTPPESEDGQGQEGYLKQEGQWQVSLENNPTDGDSKPKFPLRTPSCLYCRAKQKPALAQAHWITKCPFVTCLARPEITQMLPDVCLGCLRKKRRNQVHKCPDYMKKASNAEGTFCASCKAHVKLCVNPNLHQAVTLPESFAGAGP